MLIVPRHWIITCLVAACMARAHHVGHHFVPVPFPYFAGSYRHTSSVVNVPVHQERLIVVKKPGNHHQPQQSTIHGHKHGHGYRNDYHHHHFIHSQGYSGQESRIPQLSTDMGPFLSYYHSPHSQHSPFFQDLSFLLDPRLTHHSIWLD